MKILPFYCFPYHRLSGRNSNFSYCFVVHCAWCLLFGISKRTSLGVGIVFSRQTEFWSPSLFVWKLFTFFWRALKIPWRSKYIDWCNVLRASERSDFFDTFYVEFEQHVLFQLDVPSFYKYWNYEKVTQKLVKCNWFHMIEYWNIENKVKISYQKSYRPGIFRKCCLNLVKTLLSQLQGWIIETIVFPRWSVRR